MIYRGRVSGRMVVLDDDVQLPDGTIVRVELLPENPAKKTLADQFADVIGSVPDLPSDMAARHDHYLHGAPKE